MLATLALCPWSGHAGEPVQLALATTSASSHATTSTNKITPKIAKVGTNAFALSITQPAVTPALQAKTNCPTDGLLLSGPVTVLIEKEPESGGWFSEQSGNGSFGIANLQTGYGQAYDCDSILLRGRNGTGWEETRYFFVKKVVRF